MRIILLGAPGSGKGTQGDLVAKKFGFPRISTGDLLRQAVQQQTALGKAAEALMNQGLLVPDEIVEELVKDRIAGPDCRKGYILDGFPRNIPQAQALEKMDGKRPEVVIGIEAAAPILVKRLSQRWLCPECQAVYNMNVRAPKDKGRCDACHSRLIQRDDDRPEVIRERIKVYQDQTAKLIRYYREKNVYRPVNGEGTVDSIFQEIAKALEMELTKLEETRVRP
jgi:adenylate kinase